MSIISFTLTKIVQPLYHQTWLLNDILDNDFIPMKIRYLCHPNIMYSPSTVPVKGWFNEFRGHQFKVGSSKK